MPRTSKNWTPEMRAAQSKRLKAFWDAKKAAKAVVVDPPKPWWKQFIECIKGAHYRPLLLTNIADLASRLRWLFSSSSM